MQQERDRVFFSLLSQLQRAYAKSLGQRLAFHGVRPGYIDILNRLWEGDSIPQKQLRTSMDREQATLSNTLQRMERDNLICRVRNPQDRRQTLITLTDYGKDVEKAVDASLDDVQKTAASGLTVNDRRYFYRIVQQMTENLTENPDDTPLILVDEIPE